MRRVLIFEGYMTSVFPAGPDVESAVLGPDFQISIHRRFNDVPRKQLAGAEALVVRPGLRLGSEVITELDSCRVIVSLGAGVDHIDRTAAGERGIPVCHVPDYCVDEVADSALGMLLYLERRLGAHRCHARENPAAWDWTVLQPVRRIRGKVLGVIGLGRIGTSMALKARAVGYEVLFYDPYRPLGLEKAMGLRRAGSLEETLQKSSSITIHTPATPETVGLLDADVVDRMGKEGVLINVSRGPLLASLDILYDALREWPTFRAGLDVLPQEPPPEHPLLEAWRNDEAWLSSRFVLTPHAAFYSTESIDELRRSAIQVVKRALEDGTLINRYSGQEPWTT